MRVHLTSSNGLSYKAAVVLAANDAWVVDVPPMHLGFGTGILSVQRGKLYAHAKHGDTYVDGVLLAGDGYREWKAWETLETFTTPSGWKVTWYPKAMFAPRVVYSVGDVPHQSIPLYLAPKSIVVEFVAVPPGQPMSAGFAVDDLEDPFEDPFEDIYASTGDYDARYMFNEKDL